MLLYGMRRMGKTSTLNLLSTRLGAGLVSLRVDLQGVQVETSAGLLRSLAMQMASSGLEFGIHLPSLDANELAKASAGGSVMEPASSPQSVRKFIR